MMLRIDFDRGVAMPPKYKNRPIWAAMAAISNFFQPPTPKAATHYGGYSYKFS
jgi:hypothetical protein